MTCRLLGVAPKRIGTLYIGKSFTVGLAPVHGTEPLWNGTVVLPSAGWRLSGMEIEDAYISFVSEATRDWATRPEILDGPWTSGPFDRPVRSVVARDVLLVGDAAGYFDPLTGQGVFQALRTAQLAADTVERVCCHGEKQASTFRRYARQVRGLQFWTRAFQRGVEAVLSRETPRDLALRHLGKRSAYMDRLVQFAGDALRLRGLGRVDFLVRSPGAS